MSEQYKTAMVTVKVTPTRLEEFRIASMLRGTTMSALLSQFMAQVVREEIAAVPQAFQRRSTPIMPNGEDFDERNNNVS